MGCGALCGDTTTAITIVRHHSKKAFQSLLSQLSYNKQLINSQPYSSFLQVYQQSPQSFQLPDRQQLSRNEQINPEILLKWKLIIFGLDKNDKNYQECVGLSSSDLQSQRKSVQQLEHSQSNMVFFHQSFTQIEKDISRTFDTPISQSKKKELENILKRIANHFPKMGYTQGINFIVSYLIIVGYSQKDVFEIFVHLATNKRYLLLGLYQDGFPLYSIFTIIFQNTLKRMNGILYVHIFQKLGVDPSMWICKWFMTFYLYSFPKELIKYIWDLVVLIGALGMVTIAVSLIQQLELIILQIQDLSDLDIFFSSLRDFQCFNHHVNLQQLIAKAYTIEFYISDFNTIEDINNFYGLYLKAQFKLNCIKQSARSTQLQNASLQQQQAERLLHTWRKTLIQQRNTFRDKHRQSNINLQIYSIGKIQIPDENNKDYPQQVKLKIEQPRNLVSTSQSIRKVRKNSISAQSQSPAYTRQKLQYEFSQINQKVEEEEVSSISKYQKIPKRQIPKDIDFDELDKFQLEFKDKQRKQLNYAPNLVKNNFSSPQNDRIGGNNLKIINESNSLSVAGHISIRKDYDEVSISSKKASNKQKSKNMPGQYIKVPKNNRICGCKTKTEQNKFSSVENSQKSQSKDQFSDKDSISNKNFSQNQYNGNSFRSKRDTDTQRERADAHNQFMTNSHGPDMKEKISQNLDGRLETDIQVMVLQFKKNKKARVNLVSQMESLPKDKLFKIGWQQEQESLESINQIDKISLANSHCSQLNQYEIQSIR